MEAERTGSSSHHRDIALTSDLHHYVLPEGNVQIAFSGGRTSAYMLHRIVLANGGLPEDRVEVTFQNTGKERPETLDFVQEVGQRFGVLITWLEYRPKMPLFEVVGYQGASRDRMPSFPSRSHGAAIARSGKRSMGMDHGW